MQKLKFIILNCFLIVTLTVVATAEDVFSPESQQAYANQFLSMMKSDELEQKVVAFMTADTQKAKFEDACGSEAREAIMGDLSANIQSFEAFKTAFVAFITGIEPIIQSLPQDALFVNGQHAGILNNMNSFFDALKHNGKLAYAVRYAFIHFMQDHEFEDYCSNKDIIKFLIKANMLWDEVSLEIESAKGNLQNEFLQIMALQSQTAEIPETQEVHSEEHVEL